MEKQTTKTCSGYWEDEPTRTISGVRVALGEWDGVEDAKDESVFYYMDNEPLQVVKYDPGGFYNDHHDACCDDDSKCNEFIQNGGQRVLTILIYLNDDFEGGATKFSTIVKDIKPPKYGGVIFRPLADNSEQCHPLALHKGTPVNSGTKYICNLWIRQDKYK
jgi:prolyl 4-hydroxylase